MCPHILKPQTHTFWVPLWMLEVFVFVRRVKGWTHVGKCCRFIPIISKQRAESFLPCSNDTGRRLELLLADGGHHVQVNACSADYIRRDLAFFEPCLTGSVASTLRSYALYCCSCFYPDWAMLGCKSLQFTLQERRFYHSVSGLVIKAARHADSSVSDCAFPQETYFSIYHTIRNIRL